MAVLVAVWAFVWAPPPSAAKPASKLHRPISSAMLPGLKVAAFGATRLSKWQAVYARHRAQISGSASQCGRDGCASEWGRILAEIRGLPRLKLVESINRYVNRARYTSDSGDRWATPVELFRRGGDCEDYAIAKFLLLRELGIPESRMRILTLRATATQAAHAVLVVDTNAGALVLDNLRTSPYPLSRTVLSRIIYAFDARTWWVVLGAAPVATAGR